MSQKIVIQLPVPRPASHDCLPHAAMSLGSPGAATLRPTSAMVARLVIEEQLGGWLLYRIDEAGGFVGDSWHPSREDALAQAKKEFGVEAAEASGGR